MPALGSLLHRTGAAGAVLFLSLLALVGFGSPVQAHSELTGSTPEVGARLTQAPTSVTLSFNEQVPIGMAHLTLTRPGGDVESLQAGEGLQPTELVAKVPTLTRDVPAGDWVIGYRVTSVDGHPVQGQLTFSVGLVGGAASTGADPTGAASPSAAPGATINTSKDDDSTVSTLVIAIIVAVPTVFGCVLLARARRRSQRGA